MKNYFLSKTTFILCFLGVCASAQAISISVNPASVVCAVSVSGQAISSPGIPATNVSLYVSLGGKDYPLVINQILPADGKFTWSGPVEGVSSLAGASVKAFTNRQTMATAAINGSCAAGVAAPPLVDSNKCLSDAFKGRAGWRCVDVVGGWDYGQKQGVSAGICSRADAEALGKAGDVANCNNFIFNLNDQLQAVAKKIIGPVLNEADAAVSDLKSRYAAAADANGANKVFWATWTRIYNNCKGVQSNSPPNTDRMLNYCGIDEKSTRNPTVGIVGLITVLKSCGANTCALDASKVSFPAN